MIRFYSNSKNKTYVFISKLLSVLFKIQRWLVRYKYSLPIVTKTGKRRLCYWKYSVLSNTKSNQELIIRTSWKTEEEWNSAIFICIFFNLNFSTSSVYNLLLCPSLSITSFSFYLFTCYSLFTRYSQAIKNLHSVHSVFTLWLERQGSLGLNLKMVCYVEPLTFKQPRVKHQLPFKDVPFEHQHIISIGSWMNTDGCWKDSSHFYRWGNTLLEKPLG